ncbi:hypothetical protein MTR_8g470070 [Medicago truncatula]|uniref:Uncharacterized protein n=1 Tax=Medicago truncatula TaxID=3880 RepID=A0A072U2C2_MEDTR|nr:hypothetical protein MTR_8g470070 [Medicago truncatula]
MTVKLHSHDELSQYEILDLFVIQYISESRNIIIDLYKGDNTYALRSIKAAWRIFSFDINFRRPSVERLSIDLENEQGVVYNDNDDLEEVIANPIIQATKFLAWFDAN